MYTHSETALIPQAMRNTRGRLPFGWTSASGSNDVSKAELFEVTSWLVRDPVRKQSVFLFKRWVVERSFAWLSRFRRDYERLRSSLQQLYFVVFACLMLARHATSS